MKTADPMAAQIVKHPFLHGLTHEQVTLLTDCALPAHFRPGQVIFREGEHAARFYLLTRGKVAIESGRDDEPGVVIDTIGAGDLLGWSWMMPPYRWHFTARAIEPTEAIFFASPILREYCERHPSLGMELHKRMSAVMMKRLQLARKKMVALNAQEEKLQPVIGVSPFMEQEFDTAPEKPKVPDFAEGAD